MLFSSVCFLREFRVGSVVNAALFPAPVDFVPYVALFPAWVPAPVPWSSSVASHG